MQAVRNKAWLNMDASPWRSKIEFVIGFALSELGGKFIIMFFCYVHAIDCQALHICNYQFRLLRSVKIMLSINIKKIDFWLLEIDSESSIRITIRGG